MMEVDKGYWFVSAVAAAVLVAGYLAWRAVDWALLTPRRLERELRKQGLRGSRYRPIHGDLREEIRLREEAKSKPMPLHSHDISPRISPLLYRAMEEHGKSCITWVGPRPRVTITDPELVREILSTKFGHFGRPKPNKVFKLLAAGLVSYEGEKWAAHRRILNPAFHLEKLKLMLPAFTTCSIELVERWETLFSVPTSAADVDVWPEFQNFTGDVISRSAFGSSYKEGRKIFDNQREQARILSKNLQNIFLPGYRFLPTSCNLRLKAIAKETRVILADMIEKREKAMSSGEHAGNDLLGLLIESNCGGGGGGFQMTTDDVIEECKLFYFAGNETTSVLLTWTMLVLAMNQEWQARAREEVLHVFGNKDKLPHYNGLSHLKTVTMILYEVLRLYPPVVNFSRMTYKPMKVGGISYPPGVMLALSILHIHHDPEFWGTDAVEFRPDRFADGVSKASRVPGAFFPFSAGPQVCIGQNFAMMEAKMCLSMILQRFAFELSPSYIHSPHTNLILQPQHGAQIKLLRL